LERRRRSREDHATPIERPAKQFYVGTGMIDRFGFSHLALANRLDLNWLQEAASER
jgi:hypothetical protein